MFEGKRKVNVGERRCVVLGNVRGRRELYRKEKGARRMEEEGRRRKKKKEDRELGLGTREEKEGKEGKKEAASLGPPS
jgi:hypothetical protein